MKWYKITFVSFELKKQLDKKLIKDFIALLVKLDTPVGLAMHTLPEDYMYPDKLNYYFSAPDDIADKLKTIFDQTSFSEIPAPDINKLNIMLGIDQ